MDALLVQEEVADKEERRRDAQADFDRVDELMMQRRESVGSMQQPGLTFDRNASETVPDLLKEWDEEEAGVKAALTKVPSSIVDPSVNSYMPTAYAPFP